MRKYVLLDENNIVLGTEYRDITDQSQPYGDIWQSVSTAHYIPDDLEPEVGTLYKHEIE